MVLGEEIWHEGSLGRFIFGTSTQESFRTDGTHWPFGSLLETTPRGVSQFEDTESGD